MSKMFGYSILIFAVGFLYGQQPTEQVKNNVKQLEWLTGTWMRTNVKPGRSGFEVWKMSSETELIGTGVSMKGKDTTFIEKLKIVAKEGDIFYVADVPENNGVVFFKMTESTDTSVVFENPEHDFPKKIFYKIDGKTLCATVSGGGKSIEYIFIRK